MPGRPDRGKEPYDVLRVHDHSCQLVENRAEEFQALLDFSRAGVRRGEKCLLVMSEQPARDFGAWAAKDGEIAPAMETGAVVLATVPEIDPRPPSSLLERLEHEARAAETEGFAALRLACDLRAILGPRPSASDFLSFRHFLTDYLPRHQALALCLYDRGTLPYRIIREALYSHPILIYEGRALRNPAVENGKGGEGDLARREVDGMLRCLSEHSRLELFLSEAEGRYRNLVQLSPEAIIVEVGGRIAWINQAGLELFRARVPGELLQRPLISLILPEQRELLGDPSGLPIPDDYPGCREEGFLRLDGSRFYAEVKRLPLIDRDGRAVLVLVRDISEGRLAAEALRRSAAETEEARDLVEGLLQSVADGVIVTDLHHRIRLMNSAAEKMLNVPLAEAAGHPLSAVIPDEHLREQFTIFSWQWGAETQQVEFSLPDEKKGGGRSIQARLSVLRGKKGKRTGVITVLQDVTLQRQFERIKNELVATIAHELRTPLTAVMGFSELLLDPPAEIDSQQKREFISEIHGQAVRLKKLTDNLVDINRFESGQTVSLVKSRCALGELLRLKVARFQVGHPGYRLKIELTPEEPGDFWLDPDKIEQVVENLLSNAVKYSPPESEILLRGQRMGDHYLLVVQDQGIGMTQAQKEHVFDKFYRVDRSNTAQGGIGLGMSLVRYIINAHGGRIWIRSRAGEGTSVFFTLPQPK